MGYRNLVQTMSLIRGSLWRIVEYIWKHPNNEKKKCFSVIKFVAWQIYKRLIKKPLKVTLCDGVKIYCYSDSKSGSAVIYSGGFPDINEYHFYNSLLREGDSVIDIGANIGLYALFFASIVGEKGAVYAFEPDSTNYNRLKDNVILNDMEGIVKLEKKIVSDAVGCISFNSGNDVLCSISTNGYSKEIIDTVTIDEWIEGKKILVCKMDVEGAELLVLKGARAALGSKNPILWQLEINDLAANFNYTPEDIVNYLDSAGYNIARYDVNSNELILDKLAWQKNQNVFAISDLGINIVKERVKGVSVRC